MKWSFAVPSAHRIPLLRTERRRDFQFRKGIPDFLPAKELIWPIITPISYLKNVFSVQMLLFQKKFLRITGFLFLFFFFINRLWTCSRKCSQLKLRQLLQEAVQTIRRTNSLILRNFLQSFEGNLCIYQEYYLYEASRGLDG